MRFIDTNIFIRSLTCDDHSKAERCFSLLKRLEDGKEKATTCEAVIAEVVYVLSSKSLYSISRKKIRDLLYPILLLRGLQIENKELYLLALELYAQTKIDFDDAIVAAHMGKDKIKEIYSYDKHFNKIPSSLTAGTKIRRIEP